MKKVCVVTGTRAEYGLLRWAMEEIRKSSELQLQVIATGTHLSPEFGLTYKDIEQDGFVIDRKVEVLLSSDTPIGTTKATGLAMIGFADALAELEPDLVLILGDRFEILAVAAAAMFARIPIAHLHGGEVTAGAFDEGIRHAITKMSQLHFVATAEAERRVLQLGEQQDHVFLVGGLAVDGMRRVPLMSRQEVEESLNFRLGKQNLLITWLPATLENETAGDQLAELLEALESFPDVHCVLTYPNADPGSRSTLEQLNRFVAADPKHRAVYTSLGQRRYWSVMKQVDAVVGNSSSGLLEAPSFQVATVDIGDRQQGRERAASVIHSVAKCEAIQQALRTVLSRDFRARLDQTKNPYGDGGAADRIVSVLQSKLASGLSSKKHFCDQELHKR